MSTFIKSLGEAIGYSIMNENTEVRVFPEEEFRIAVPGCCSELQEGGYVMTASELEDSLSTNQLDDSGEYEVCLQAGRFETVDDGIVVLRNVVSFTPA